MRLASADLLTAAAVIGTIDALSDWDAVVPDVDLTAPVPDNAEKNLVDLELEELLELTISGQNAPIPPEAFDLGTLELEQLLAFELDDSDLAPTDLALLPLEDLLAIDVQMEDPEPIRAPFDLTGIALEALQDIQYGEVGSQPQNPYRQVAELDIASAFDQQPANDEMSDVQVIGTVRGGGGLTVAEDEKVDLARVEISLPEVNDISAGISGPPAGDTTDGSADEDPQPDESEEWDDDAEDDGDEGVPEDDEDGGGDDEDGGDDDVPEDDENDEDDGDDEDDEDEDGNNDRDDDDNRDDKDNGGDGDDDAGDFSAVGLSSAGNLLFAEDNAGTFSRAPAGDDVNLVPPTSAPADPVSLMPDDVVL